MGHHHQHRHVRHVVRKTKKTPYDFLIYFFMIATPLFELPQAIMIYTTRDASGVSIWTWTFFFMASFVWLSYGIRNKLLPLIVAYSLYAIMESAIIVGILLYS